MNIRSVTRALPWLALAVVFSLGASCEQPADPKYPIVSEPVWVAPSASLPPEVKPGLSNNNVAISLFEKRLYLAWRTAPIHFASPDTRMVIISSPDLGKSWRFEKEIAIGTDLREPFFIVMGGKLILYYVELGKEPTEFTPKRVWRVTKAEGGAWTEPELAPLPDETIPWELKVRDGVAYMTGYKGNHYSASDPANIEVYFKKSTDGLNWTNVEDVPFVYKGGVSEVGFEFDSKGDLWAVTRNEDGDESGFGSHLATAKAGALGHWDFPKKTNPYRYDSPRMFRLGEDLYLVARRNILYVENDKDVFTDWPYDLGTEVGTVPQRRVAYLAAYSLTPKRTSIYKINRDKRVVERIKDLPSCSDTSFASIVQIGPKKFLVANYSTPIVVDPKKDVDTRRWAWIRGQVDQTYGTGIYLTTLEFE